MDPTPLVRLATQGGVATITLDSPQNRNALSSALVAQLRGALGDAIDDGAVRVIVLTGAGSVFCSGADLSEKRDANAAGGPMGLAAVAAILERIWTAPKPVVARVNGHARAGGIGLVAACDLAIANERATFAFSEVRIGVAPAMIASVVIPRIGPAKAMELMLGGEPFDAAEAARIGLINAAVPEGGLDAAVAARVAQLALGAPGALRETKAIVRAVPAMPFGEGLRAMTTLSERLFASQEALEGMTAFRERRRPSWQPPG
jgi:methylglutaconyl-CoA hydratase